MLIILTNLLIHDNIRFLRTSKKVSQAKLAKAIGLKMKRSNIASYEISTSPPLPVLVKLARNFNVSVDDLLTVDLSRSLVASESEPAVSDKDILSRLEKVIALSGKDQEEFADSVKVSTATLNNVLNAKTRLSMDLLVSVVNACSWLNLEWFLRGKGTMVVEKQPGLEEVEDPAGKYITGERARSLELEIGQLKKRMAKIEKQLVPTNQSKPKS